MVRVNSAFNIMGSVHVYASLYSLLDAAFGLQ
jgi:hypothetical protein